VRFLPPLAAILVSTSLSLAATPEPDAFRRDEDAWRAQRLAGLTGETGWLSLVGLHWLKEGENGFGTDPRNEVVLPEGTAAGRVGSFVLRGEDVRLVLAPGSALTVNGKPAEEGPLKADADGEPDLLRVGRLQLFVIQRGDRLAIRVKDPQSPARTGFRGLEYFPASPRYRVVADFVPYDPPKDVAIPTILGTVETMKAPGKVTFTIDGTKLSLEPVLETPDAKELFFIFKDGTSGEETYPAGRYVYTPLPENGKVVLDFNHAYNPPCAFTPYATCPFPTKENVLPVSIEAGEKAYAHP
jgi:uncharacterized protein (DUF1684 family)